MTQIQHPNFHAGKAIVKAQADCIDDLRATIAALQSEIARLRETLRLISEGLRGPFASRLDMANLAEAALSAPDVTRREE